MILIRNRKLIILALLVLILSNIFLATKKYQTTTQQLKDLQDNVKKLEVDNEKLRKENKELNDLTEEYKVELKIFKEKIMELSRARYDSSDISKKSNVTEIQLYNALEGTNMQTLAWDIVEAENLYGVNSLFLTGLIAQESGFGTSRRFKEDNNVGGYEVYNDSARGRIFNSKSESVFAVAKLLNKHYLNKNGKYHKGTSSYAINISYCTTSEDGQFEWHSNIDKIANELKDKINLNYHS